MKTKEIKTRNLNDIKQFIEKLDKSHHIEILKIITKNVDAKVSENKSGVYVNLTFLPECVIDEIDVYIDYVKDQEKFLNPIETKKESLKNTLSQESEAEVDHEYIIPKPNKDINISVYSY
jgi:hypothetical protein